MYKNHESVFEDSTRNFDYALQEIGLNEESIKCKCSNDNSLAINLIRGGQKMENVWMVKDY